MDTHKSTSENEFSTVKEHWQQSSFKQRIIRASCFEWEKNITNYQKVCFSGFWKHPVWINDEIDDPV